MENRKDFIARYCTVLVRLSEHCTIGSTRLLERWKIKPRVLWLVPLGQVQMHTEKYRGSFRDATRLGSNRVKRGLIGSMEANRPDPIEFFWWRVTTRLRNSNPMNPRITCIFSFYRIFADFVDLSSIFLHFREYN